MEAHHFDLIIMMYHEFFLFVCFLLSEIGLVPYKLVRECVKKTQTCKIKLLYKSQKAVLKFQLLQI